MSPETTNLIPLDQAGASIRDGDLLLSRNRRSLIAIAGRGSYCHAAMAAWWGDELMCLESRLTGIRAVTLRSRVQQAGATIDVFTANPDDRWPEFRPQQAIQAMRAKTGRRYGLVNLLRTAATHVALVRLLVRPDTRDNGSDEDSRSPEFCSQAVSSALRLGGGVDPVPELRDRFTEPDDLARSAFFQYRFTLTS